MGSKGKEDRKRMGSIARRGPFAAAVDAYFREQDDGRVIFRRVSLFNRRGYLVASAEQMLLLRESVHQYLRAYVTTSIVFMVVLSLFFSAAFLESRFWQQLALLAGVGVVHWIAERSYFHPFTKKMDPIDISISWFESSRFVGRRMSPAFLASGSLVFVGMSAFMFHLFLEEAKPIFLVFGLMSAVTLVSYGIGWRHWWSARHES
mgnify:CR=1 FL=1